VLAKPDQSSGSRGVRVFRDSAALTKAFPSGPPPRAWVLEEFVDGSQHSLEVIGRPGNYRALQVTDLYVDEEFDPKLGFVRRRGVKRYDAELAWRPRLNGELVRRLFFELEPVLVTDLGNDLQTAEVELQPFGVQLESAPVVGDGRFVPGVRLFELGHMPVDHGLRRRHEVLNNEAIHGKHDTDENQDGRTRPGKVRGKAFERHHAPLAHASTASRRPSASRCDASTGVACPSAMRA